MRGKRRAENGAKSSQDYGETSCFSHGSEVLVHPADGLLIFQHYDVTQGRPLPGAAMLAGIRTEELNWQTVVDNC